MTTITDNCPKCRTPFLLSLPSTAPEFTVKFTCGCGQRINVHSHEAKTARLAWVPAEPLAPVVWTDSAK